MAHTQKLITKFNLDRKNQRFKPHDGSLCVFRPRPQPRIRIVLNALSGAEKIKPQRIRLRVVSADPDIFEFDRVQSLTEQ